MKEIDLGDLALDEGGHLLLRHALQPLAAGEKLVARGRAPDLTVHLGAWCRAEGHRFERTPGGAPVITKAEFEAARWAGAERAGQPAQPEASAPGRWGLAARGALLEAGAPELAFRLDQRSQIWADEAARLYAQAAAAQWDPASAIPWGERFELSPELEGAVVQLMTYLVENETAALIIPARFAGQVHPHFREVQQLLAIQAADEARHVEVFTRRALLKRAELGLSTVGGQRSLQTLLEESDFALASFLLSVLGEGTFLALLWFLSRHAPDPITREITRLAAQDEARHVAFGLAHLSRHAAEDKGLLDRLALAIERRHQSLAHTNGLNAEVFDSLLLLAAGSLEPSALRRGWHAVQALEREMLEGRAARLVRLGFGEERALALASLHTRNFM